MKKTTFTVHPLFWVCGIYFCVIGQLFAFLLTTLAALEHEYAHASAAAKRGYALDTVVLMPYGAIVRGDIGGISLRDELAVAAAGPLASVLTALAFTALWWLFPETYPYTDTAFLACSALFFVNLLPALPLDGGRIAYCLLARFCGKKRAGRVCAVLTAITCLALSAAFVYTCCRGTPNLSLLFFVLFLALGAWKGKEHAYLPIRYDFSEWLARGTEERRVAVGEDFPLRKAIAFFSERYPVLDVFNSEGYLGTLYAEDILSAVGGVQTAGEALREKLKKTERIQEKTVGGD